MLGALQTRNARGSFGFCHGAIGGTVGITFIICALVLPFPCRTDSCFRDYSRSTDCWPSLMVLHLCGYYLSHPGPRVPKIALRKDAVL